MSPGWNINRIKRLLFISVECHPHYPQRRLSRFCSAQGIHLQAYSSLGTTTSNSPLLVDPKVLRLAEKYSKSPAQILLRWGLDSGFSVLPKSTNEQHIRENFDLFDFELDKEEVESVCFKEGEEASKYAWNPNVVL